MDMGMGNDTRIWKTGRDIGSIYETDFYLMLYVLPDTPCGYRDKCLPSSEGFSGGQWRGKMAVQVQHDLGIVFISVTPQIVPCRWMIKVLDSRRNMSCVATMKLLSSPALGALRNLSSRYKQMPLGE